MTILESGTTGVTEPVEEAGGSLASPRRWTEPEGLRPRGTVILIGGRGETPAVYDRFGRRLSADAYRVVAYASPVSVEAVVADVDGGVASDELPEPIVVAGSDTGAVIAVDIARALGTRAAGLLLAAYPSASQGGYDGDWEGELGERTTCPVHRSLLATEEGFRRGALAAPLEEADVVRDLGDLELPILALHGGADAVSPVADARRVYDTAPAAEVWLLEGAKHDVLNDSTHRTTAAVVVQYLERLRTASLEPIARRIR